MGSADGGEVPAGTRPVQRALPPMNRWAILVRPDGLDSVGIAPQGPAAGAAGRRRERSFLKRGGLDKILPSKGKPMSVTANVCYSPADGCAKGAPFRRNRNRLRKRSLLLRSMERWERLNLAYPFHAKPPETNRASRTLECNIRSSKPLVLNDNSGNRLNTHFGRAGF